MHSFASIQLDYFTNDDFVLDVIVIIIMASFEACKQERFLNRLKNVPL